MYVLPAVFRMAPKYYEEVNNTQADISLILSRLSVIQLSSVL